ncbi:GntR family transcriptional regulator [Nocardioidaceae bacterium]|nr:GntR family transcriptional regulator [Nocardioidaceae bacterium]
MTASTLRSTPAGPRRGRLGAVSSETPPYARLVAAVQAQVASGELSAGDRLPPVRTWAEREGLAAGTVARAVKELEARGVVETRGRAGTFVRGEGTEQAARAAAVAYARTQHRLGLEEAEAVRLLQQAWRALRG